jgi:hypothetical protein
MQQSFYCKLSRWKAIATRTFLCIDACSQRHNYGVFKLVGQVLWLQLFADEAERLQTREFDVVLCVACILA